MGTAMMGGMGEMGEDGGGWGREEGRWTGAEW